MSLSTEWDDELEAKRGAPPPLGMPEVPADDLQAPPEAASGDETAQPPGPVAEGAPQSKPATTVELLAQVKAGQLSRPAIDTAFGPPPTPQNEPGAQTFAPKLGDSAGIDWKGLSDKLSAARDRQSSLKTHDNVLNNINSVLNPRFHSDSGDGGVAGAEDEVKLSEAKQADAEKQRAAMASGDELKRRAEADQWRRFDAGLNGVSAAQAAADKAKGDAEKEKLAAEGRAMTGDREDQKMRETQRQHDLEHEDRLAGMGSREKLAAAKAKKGSGPPAPVLNEGELDKVPADIRPQVRAAIETQSPIPSAATKNPTQQRIRAYVFQVKPDMDEGAYARRNATVQHMANEGDIRALPVAMHHIDLARKAIESTPESVTFESPMLNRMAQSVITGAGGTEFVGPNFGLKVAGDEVAAVYGANTEKKAEAIGKLFDPHATKAQKLAVLDEAERYIAGKVEGAQESIARVDPKGVSHFDLMTPSVKAALGGGEVTVTNRRTKQSRKMSAKDAAKYRDQDAYEVQ